MFIRYHAFMVTEVYLKEDGKCKMGSLTFSTLLRPAKMIIIISSTKL